MPLLEVENLAVRFRSRTGVVPAVNGVSLVDALEAALRELAGYAGGWRPRRSGGLSGTTTGHASPSRSP